jgi:hypothetical protein
MSADVDTGVETQEEYHERMERRDQAMRDAGVAADETVQVDYFGFEETEHVFLPDGKSHVTIQALNEGGRRRYLNRVNREVKIAKQTGDAIMQLANGDERRILLAEAIVGWNLVRRNKNDGTVQPLIFNEAKLNDFLTTANPKVIDIIDKAVRAQNPWLMADVTLEDLLKQKDELEEQIEKKRAEEEGKES